MTDRQSRAASRPRNVIVFVIDDCGREYLRCYDNTTYNAAAPEPRLDPLSRHWANQWGEAAQDRSRFDYPPTPWLDSLARRGMLLERMNVGAMCSPTRASLLTGLHNSDHTLGNAIQGDANPALALRGRTLYQRMEERGAPHHRVHVGKWHISNSYLQQIGGRPLGRRNTEASFATPVKDGGATHYSGSTMNLGPDAPGYEFDPPAQHYQRYVHGEHDGLGGDFRVEQRTSHSLWDESESAIAAIQRARAAGKPFLMNVWFHAVHAPIEWDAMGGRHLARRGLHHYGADDPGDYALRAAAFVQSVDSCCARVEAALTPEERRDTAIVFLSDNGTTSRMLDSRSSPSLPPVGDGGNPYSPSHSKRSPWQGGIGGACVIASPDVVNRGDGAVPRVWSGLCGVEDLHEQLCRWVGVPLDDLEEHHVLDEALRDTSATGRRQYTQCAFQNGFHDDMFAEAQGGSVRFVSQQNHAAWKLLWIRAGDRPMPEVTWEWQLYDMTRDPLERTNLFPEAVGAETIQQRYGRLGNVERVQFGDLYTELAERRMIPPGMSVELA